MKRFCLPLILTAGISLFGCGGDDEGHGMHEHEDVECLGGEDAYVGGTVTGESGVFTIELLGATPNPHIEGDGNNLDILVTDAEGNPVDDVTFDNIEEFSTAHGMHGAPGEITVEPLGEGRYTIQNLNYVHAGTWEVRFTLSKDGASDFLVFELCIAPEGTVSVDAPAGADASAVDAPSADAPSGSDAMAADGMAADGML